MAKAQTIADRLDHEFTASVGQNGTKAEVIAFLKLHKIAYYDSPTLKLITASIPDIEKGTLTKFGVYMKFNFDAGNRLRVHEIKAIGTGP